MSVPEIITESQTSRKGEQGFLLVGVIVMVALVLIALSVAAPIVAKDLKREKELEAVHRGQQYTRALRLYYTKFKSYPNSVKLLEGDVPKERFLRQHYLDPMTGKDDWRLIAVGQAKTTVKGFFGEPLGGLPGAPGGPGGAPGPQPGGPSPGTTGPAIVPPGSTTGTGQTPDPGSSSGSNSPFESGTTGPFLGVGIPKAGDSIITLNEQTDYSKWEFIYDPRIEQLYAKSSLFGGGIATAGPGLGSPTGPTGTPTTPPSTTPDPIPAPTPTVPTPQ